MREKLKNKKPGFVTRAIHHGQVANKFLGALTPPVFMTSTYAFSTVEEGEAIFRDDAQGYVYGRTRNPTQALFEARIASLEGAEAGLALASGMAAISATMFSLLEAGDHVLFNSMLYGNSFELFSRGLPHFGIKSTIVDFTDLERVTTTLKRCRPKFIFFETPSNPALAVVDAAAVAALAKQAGALTVVDNTFATPLLQRPLELGADLIVHSATKYLGGHGDLIAGAVVGPARLIEEIRRKGLGNLTGATIAPLTAFLLLRGLKTLELRMERHCSSALAIARDLHGHPAVSWVSYPGLEGSRFYEVARRQMSAFGGLIACELQGGKRAGIEFMNRLKLIRLAVSLGISQTDGEHDPCDLQTRGTAATRHRRRTHPLFDWSGICGRYTRRYICRPGRGLISSARDPLSKTETAATLLYRYLLKFHGEGKLRTRIVRLWRIVAFRHHLCSKRVRCQTPLM